jgi:Leucine Rich Repeat (LRR) protein
MLFKINIQLKETSIQGHWDNEIFHENQTYLVISAMPKKSYAFPLKIKKIINNPNHKGEPILTLRSRLAEILTSNDLVEIKEGIFPMAEKIHLGTSMLMVPGNWTSELWLYFQNKIVDIGQFYSPSISVAIGGIILLKVSIIESFPRGPCQISPKTEIFLKKLTPTELSEKIKQIQEEKSSREIEGGKIKKIKSPLLFYFTIRVGSEKRQIPFPAGENIDFIEVIEEATKKFGMSMQTVSVSTPTGVLLTSIDFMHSCLMIEKQYGFEFEFIDHRVVGCFSGNTDVFLPDNTSIQIENAQKGISILSFDLVKQKVVSAIIENIHVFQEQSPYLINNMLKVTAEHPIFIAHKGWVRVKNLCIGDEYISIKPYGKYPINEITKLTTSETVFNLTLSTPSTFFANGILVHNMNGKIEENIEEHNGDFQNIDGIMDEFETYYPLEIEISKQEVIEEFTSDPIVQKAMTFFQEGMINRALECLRTPLINAKQNKNIDEQNRWYEIMEDLHLGVLELLQQIEQDQQYARGLQYIKSAIQNFEIIQKPEWVKEYAPIQIRFSQLIEPKKTLEYHENMLEKSDYEVMIGLEKIVGEEIPRVSKIEWDTFGFIADHFKVIALGLYNKGLKCLPENLVNLSSLRELQLYDNQLSSLPNNFSNLTSLKILSIYSNQLMALPKNFFELYNLHSLNLQDNQLSALPESFFMLKNLKILNLSGNQFSSLSESFGNLKSLEELYLFKNQLSSLPEGLFQLKNLQSLNLSNNKISTLPASLGNLSLLKKLWLNNNYLSSLPSNFGNLSILTRLEITFNALCSLPDSFGNLVFLEVLYLNGNELRSLPNNLGDLTSLNILDLQDNPVRYIPANLEFAIKSQGGTYYISKPSL